MRADLDDRAKRRATLARMKPRGYAPVGTEDDSALQDGAPVTVYSSTGASMPGEISSLPFRGESVEGGRDVRKNKPAAQPTQAASGAETGGYPRNANSWET